MDLCMENEMVNEQMSRNALQPLAMTAIYDALTYLDMGESVDVEAIVSSLCERPYEECDYFIKASVVLTLKHLAEIKEIYTPHLRKWTFDRLPRLSQSILLLSYVHYNFIDPEVNKGVVIDIAVRLAKKYLGEKDYKFVNGILDNVLTERLA